MVYNKTAWKDRVVERPLTFTMQNNADGSVTLAPAEGQIIDPGTALTALLMNNLEKQYDEAIAWAKEFGLGSNTKTVDWNTVSESGFYSGITGGPNGSSNYFGFHSQNSPNYATQVVQRLGVTWTRNKENGVWQAWTRLETTDGAQAKADLAEAYAVNNAVNQAKAYAMNSISTGSTADPNTTQESYILTNHANSPGGSAYWHIFTLFYSSKTGNRVQIAISYNGRVRMEIRQFFSGSWSTWHRVTAGEIYTHASRSASAAQSCAAGAWTMMTYPTVNDNVGGGTWSSSQWIVPETGIYQVHAGVQLASIVAGIRVFTAVFVGNSLYDETRLTMRMTSGGSDSLFLGNAILQLTAGQRIDFRVYHDFTGALNTMMNFFKATRIG
ncbi:pyocin knob domain-containing protein [Mesobacillus subterraneus]|uniref:Uncharacterized protein n=1 Tax=Mesobacillus subterraneus TaxID=285983 RepID=A0A3R9E2J5_9BACI|nr:pyocin knob domain-containing protein [Mesobacillus subterraneus]RSD21084.1 hypothetical protein EJA10_22565 [Mesobacillus subterraneus]